MRCVVIPGALLKIAMASGARPVLIGLRAVLVATRIGVTVSDPTLAT